MPDDPVTGLSADDVGSNRPPGPSGDLSTIAIATPSAPSAQTLPAPVTRGLVTLAHHYIDLTSACVKKLLAQRVISGRKPEACSWIRAAADTKNGGGSYCRCAMYTDNAAYLFLCIVNGG